MAGELRKLLEEAMDRLAGCAGDPCCAACSDWAERARLVLATADLAEADARIALEQTFTEHGHEV